MINTPSEQDLHAYVDGQLDEAERSAVERYLDRNPERAAEVAAWQNDAQRLRAHFGAHHSLPDNPDLQPSAIRARVSRQRQQWRMQAMAAVLCVGLGGLGGWYLSDLRNAAENPPMADAIAAYQLLALDGAAAPDVISKNNAHMQSWLDQHFENATRLPDLSSGGFTAVGGRLFATDQGPAAMVLYKNLQGHAISFYVRPPSAGNRRLPTGERSEDGLLAQYWSGQGYSYAMVSRALDSETRIVSKARQRAI